MTFYDILGVSRYASQREIRAAYRELARLHHPDGIGDADEASRAQAEENIKAINAAFHTLGDPRRRQTYHDVMWTRQDPARQYRFRPPKSRPDPDSDFEIPPSRPGRGRSSTNLAADLYIEIMQARQARSHLLEQQAVKRRRLWLSAGFTSLLVYFLIAFGSQIYPSPSDLLPLTIFFLGGELIALSIVFNASGMRLPRFPNVGSPVAFSLTVTLGAVLTCSAVLRIDVTLNPPTSLFSSIVISLALLVHLFLTIRLGRVQDVLFFSELRRINDHLRDLEGRLEDLKRKGRY